MELEAFTGTCVLSKAEETENEINRINRAGLDAGYTHLICISGKSFYFYFLLNNTLAMKNTPRNLIFTHKVCQNVCVVISALPQGVLLRRVCFWPSSALASCSL